jgi:hypothetical protein
LWGSLLHTGAAIAFTMQVASAQSAEAAHSNEIPIPMTDDFGFSAAPAAKASYKSYRYDLRNGLKTENAVRARFETDEATEALSTTRMSRGHYQLSDRSWFLKPHIADDFVVMNISEKPLAYPSANWATNRSTVTTLELSPMPSSGLENNSTMGWQTHLGLAPPEISTRFGIPSSVTQRGIMFGANYHF